MNAESTLPHQAPLALPKEGGSSDPARELAVVIIARNEAGHIEDCIRSVLAATQDMPVEVLLMDSHSEDATVAIASSFRIQILSLPADVPVSASSGRRFGAQNCRSRFIQFVDGDMTIDPSWIARALNYLKSADPATVAVAGEISQQPTDNAAREYQRRNLSQMTRTNVVKEMRSLYGAFMIRADALRQVGSFDTCLEALEEADLTDRLWAAGYRVELLPHLMCRHNVDSGEGFARSFKRAMLAARTGGRLFRSSIATRSFGFRLRQFKTSFAAAAFVFCGLAALAGGLVFHSVWPGFLWVFMLAVLYGCFVFREKGRLQHALYFLIVFLFTWIFFFYGWLNKPAVRRNARP